MTPVELNRGRNFAGSGSYPISNTFLSLKKEIANNSGRSANPQLAYCTCDYPLRDAGRDVLTGDPLSVCDECGWRSDVGFEAVEAESARVIRQGGFAIGEAE